MVVGIRKFAVPSGYSDRTDPKHSRFTDDGKVASVSTAFDYYFAAKGTMGLIRAAAVFSVDHRFRTPSLELKCLGTSFGGAKQKFSVPRDLT